AVRLPELAVDPLEDFRVDEYTKPGKFVINTIEDRTRWLDFVHWYRESMNDYTDFWMQITRKYFPQKPIYLCTGGDASSPHGSNFAAQCKVVAGHQGGIRITNEASKYATNFAITNWVSSAGKFYNAYFSFEPAGKVTEKGVVCRLYNATATGAKGLHFYEGNLFDSELKTDVFVDNLRHLYKGSVSKCIGVMYPDTSLILGDISSSDFLKGFELLREYTDYIFLDDLTIEDGILDTIKIAVICCGEIYKKQTLDILLKWVSEGGILIGYNIEKIRSAEADENYQSVLFNTQGGNKEIGKGISFYNPIKINLKEGQKEAITGAQPTFIPLMESNEYYQKNLLDPLTEFLASQGHFVTNGILNGVFEAKVDHRILLLNTEDSEVQTQITLPDGGKQSVTIGYNRIVEIEY
ncbi:MAG: hypothetical protein H7X94_13410, partial [Vallitaleaceae bacterium]|nr:hypothetical protein [Vallitaleaceae bacterium]